MGVESVVTYSDNMAALTRTWSSTKKPSEPEKVDLHLPSIHRRRQNQSRRSTHPEIPSGRTADRSRNIRCADGCQLQSHSRTKVLPAGAEPRDRTAGQGSSTAEE